VSTTGGKFATGVNDRRQICHRCQRRQWQIATGINDTGGKYWQQYQAAVTLK
jgi:hypothetical protein